MAASPVAERTNTTKTGMHQAFFEKPWRAYTVDARPAADRDTFYHPWTTKEPWGRVPSVTGVNGVLDKSRPLVAWATNVTYNGCAHLARTFGPPPAQMAAEGDEARVGAMVLKRTTKHYKIDHQGITKEAQLRGSTVHRIGEDWVNEGIFPNLKDYPPAWHGYIRAIAKFLSAHGEGLAVAEEITGSVVHGYAGTCDTVATTTFGDARVRLDYKTSKQTYARTHFRQLGAYELGAVEGGDDPCDRLAIVILGSDGEFSISFADEVEWRTTPADAFLRVLDVWRDEQPLKKHEDAAYKARIARERAANG